MKYDDFTKDTLIAIIKIRDDQIIQKDADIHRLNNYIEERAAIINTRNDQIVELNNTIKELNEQSMKKDKLINKYKKTITDNENNLSLKNDRIQELEMAIKDVKAQRDALKADHNNLNAQLEKYKYLSGEYDADTKKIILTLENGKRVEIPVADLAIKDGVIKDLKITNEGLDKKLRSKDFQINFLKSKVDWLNSRLALKEPSEFNYDTMYLMLFEELAKSYERLNNIEERLNKCENYIFGGKNND